MNLEDEVRRGQYGRDLLDNPVFQEIWTSYEQQVVQALKDGSPRDAEGREKAVMLLQILAKLRTLIEETVDTGRLAQLEIERKQTKAEQWKAWLAGSPA